MAKHAILYSNRKQPAMVWTFETQEEEAKAYLAVFKYMKESWEVYAGLEEGPPDRPQVPTASCCEQHANEHKKQLESYEHEKSVHDRQLPLYEKAKAGDAVAAKKLLTMRSDYEYEHIEVMRVENL